LIIESMKMEIVIPSLQDGIICELRCEPGQLVKAGQIVALVREDA
jgi:biotin carboxyl carrier protein